MKTKNKYTGQFNWHGEIYTLYRWAFSEEQAKSFMTPHIAKIVGVKPFVTECYFDGSKDNFKMKVMS